MKTRIYYNNDCIGEISNSYNDLDENSLPRINSILLKGNISLEELNLLSATQVRQLISQIQNVRYSETLPANPVINTLYYVGTTAPYNVYLYIEDDTTQAITRLDMGTTEQDLSQYQEKVDNSLETTSKNIVGAINENKSNIDLKQNSTDDRLTTTAKTIHGAINEIVSDKVTSISSSSTDKEYPSAKAVYDNFAPISSSWVIQDTVSTDPNTCVSSFPLHGRTLGENDRVGVKSLFFGKVVSPINNADMYGTIETLQEGYANNIFIEQIFTNKRLSNYQDTIKFRREGYLVGGSSINLEDKSTWQNSITWLSWYPIEYPRITVGIDSAVLSRGYIDIAVTGGTAVIRYNALIPINTSSGTSAIKIDNDASINLNFLGMNKFRNGTSGGYVWGGANSVESKNILICASGGSVHLYVWHVEAGVQYYGEIVVPLGY